MKSGAWKLSLERFFYDRAVAIKSTPTLYDHCMVSAKDPRVSARPEIHSDIIANIVSTLGLDCHSNVLEVGCASGYIACGLAPRVAHYTGVDLAHMPLEVARKINLSNAQFIRADGASLHFENGNFDAVLAYDVFSNFPTFDDVVPIIREMLRVVKPGGRVLIGSLTNKKTASAFAVRVQQVAEMLEVEYGALPVPRGDHLSTWERIILTISGKTAPNVKPEIINYNFDPDDFQRLAKQENVAITQSDVHSMNPYFGYRFNVVLTKQNT